MALVVYKDIVIDKSNVLSFKREERSTRLPDRHGCTYATIYSIEFIGIGNVVLPFDKDKKLRDKVFGILIDTWACSTNVVIDDRYRLGYSLGPHYV